MSRSAVVVFPAGGRGGRLPAPAPGHQDVFFLRPLLPPATVLSTLHGGCRLCLGGLHLARPKVRIVIGIGIILIISTAITISIVITIAIVVTVIRDFIIKVNFIVISILNSLFCPISFFSNYHHYSHLPLRPDKRSSPMRERRTLSVLGRTMPKRNTKGGQITLFWVPHDMEGQLVCCCFLFPAF